MLNGAQRRQEVLKRLYGAQNPISASFLAEEFGVSRQVIVQDIALIRASGQNVLSLARGYVLPKNNTFKKVFKVMHTDAQVEDELTLFVDMGCKVLNVFIYHRSYGTVKANMNIKSRADIKRFLLDLEGGKSRLLKNVTDGYHYHTLESDSEETLKMVEQELLKRGFLAPLTEYEPDEIKFSN